MRFLWGPGELSLAPFGALFGLYKFFNLLKGQAGMEVVVGGVFLHDVFGYDIIFQSLHQGVQYHLVRVGGLPRG